MPDDDTKQDPPTHAGLSEEDVGRIVNAAVTSQLKRLLPASISEAMGGLKFDDQINAALAKIQEKPADPPGSPKPANKSDLEKQLQELSAKLEAADAARAAADKARVETEQARQFDAANTAFRAALQPKLRPELLDVAVSHWGSTQKRLKLDEAGSPVLRVKRAPYKGAPEQDEDLPIAEALPLLLASEEAKPFLPAPAPMPGRGGTGPRPTGSNGIPSYDAPANSDEERAQRVMAKEAAIRAKFNITD